MKVYNQAKMDRKKTLSSIVIEGTRAKLVVIFLSVYQKKNKACVLTPGVLVFFTFKWSVF